MTYKYEQPCLTCICFSGSFTKPRRRTEGLKRKAFLQGWIDTLSRLYLDHGLLQVWGFGHVEVHVGDDGGRFHGHHRSQAQPSLDVCSTRVQLHKHQQDQAQSKDHYAGQASLNLQEIGGHQHWVCRVEMPGSATPGASDWAKLPLAALAAQQGGALAEKKS